MHEFEDNQKTFISLQICIISRESHVGKYFYIKQVRIFFEIYDIDDMPKRFLKTYRTEIQEYLVENVL